MKNQELFDKTIGILVNAYLNDTLQHQNCYACAVGNLVAANNGFNFKGKNFKQWDNDLSHQDYYHTMNKLNGGINEVGLKQIENTGYSIDDLVKIERSFERLDEDGCNRMFNGLMNVVDALMQIHEADEEEITQAKRLFVKEPA